MNNLQPFPLDSGSNVNPEDIVICSFYYCEQNGYITLSIECVKLKEDVNQGGGASCPPLLLTLKR